MPTPPHHIAKWLRLTEAGYQCLSPRLPGEVKGSRLHETIAAMPGAMISKNTVGRILKREQPVQFYSLSNLFKLFGLDIQNSDFEPFPKAKRSAPTHYHVPHELSERFTGRTQELKALRALLLKSHVAAISGLGGIGKTQTALAYCDLHKEEYASVFWVRAASESDVQQGYAEIARHLKLPGEALPEPERAAAAMRWLEKHSGWLLVLDNLDKPETGKTYFPRTPQGHVLITTRWERLDLPAIKAFFPLKTLSPPEALDFFQTTCRRKEMPATEREAAVELAERLGHLPLALAQAAAYIMHMSTFVNYLALYKKRTLAHLAKRTPVAEESPVSVNTTWEINFQAIEEEARRTPTAGKYAPQLLRFSAFLAPDDIPLEIVRCGAEAYCPELHTLFKNAEDEAEAEEIYNEVLEPLTRYSLAARKPEDQVFSLHRLVQAVTRDRIVDAEKSEWKVCVVRAMNSAFPFPEFENWKLCERLLPHAVVVGDMIRQEKVRTAEAANLLENTGRFWYEGGRYALAESCCKLAMEIKREVHKEDHSHFAVGFNNMGMLCHRQGLCEEATSHYEQALAIRRQTGPPDHLDIAECLNNLAGLNDSQGHHEEAESLFRQALDITQQKRPEEDRRYAGVLHNLALLYYRQKRDSEAERHYEQALEIWRKRLPPNHPDIANGLHNLAQLYRRQKRLVEAEPLYREALCIQEHIYPEGHPLLATTHYNIAEMYEGLGRCKEAEYHYLQMAEIDRKAFGENHTEVAADQKTLAAFYERHSRNQNQM